MDLRAVWTQFLGSSYLFPIKNRNNHKKKTKELRKVKTVAMCGNSNGNGAAALKMNLNEYMVTLEKPLGIRFALSLDGKIFVYSLLRGGNAERTRIVMVGDTLKKAGGNSSGADGGGGLVVVNDFADTQNILREKARSLSLVLERPFTPFPIHELHLSSGVDLLFNRGRVALSTWNKNILTSNLKASSEGCGNSGFVTFSPKFLSSPGWRLLNDQNGSAQSGAHGNTVSSSVSPLVCIFSDEELVDGEWAHGNFPLEEYVKALERSRGELHYNHSLGMRYSKITEQIFVGSCIQTEADVESLLKAGVSAVINFQSSIEAENWGVNPNVINDSCQSFNILMINYPMRDGDSHDMRKKLPFCVGLLLRLLKRNHRVFVTCTSGFDRSPACVIAYLHWMTDTSLHAAYNFVTGLHSCKPDRLHYVYFDILNPNINLNGRAAIAWATWDLIAMVENGRHDGPATHAVTFVWNGQEGEDVSLVGDFTGSWKEPVKVSHKDGPRYEVEVRLQQGKYYYKYIVNGNWRHSTGSPTERDERGNVNNVIVVGDTASPRPSIQQQKKDANIVKVIERPLTEHERFLLAKAARCVAFSVCPIRLSPK